MKAPRYGIAEWYGQRFATLTPAARTRLADRALGGGEPPPCPFQDGEPPCSKKYGVCSIDRYAEGDDSRLGEPDGEPVITCPRRFEEGRLLVLWLAEIVGFPPGQVQIAREVAFMRNPNTGRAAGMIDLVVATDPNGRIEWYGMEMQAVYFSGSGMPAEIEAQRSEPGDERSAPFPNAVRRPDWRSSSAKRLMPQLDVKVPLLRQWGRKTAVAVDRPFFDSIGGPSVAPSDDLDAGDVIWMVPDLVADSSGRYHLERGHWEVLTLEDSRRKLLSAEPISRAAFEDVLRSKLEPLRRAQDGP